MASLSLIGTGESWSPTGGLPSCGGFRMCCSGRVTTRGCWRSCSTRWSAQTWSWRRFGRCADTPAAESVDTLRLHDGRVYRRIRDHGGWARKWSVACGVFAMSALASGRRSTMPPVRRGCVRDPRRGGVCAFRAQRNQCGVSASQRHADRAGSQIQNVLVGRSDSNSPSPAPKAGALPGCATSRVSRPVYVSGASRRSSLLAPGLPSLASPRVGSKSSTGLPDGSSTRICLPPTPVTMSFRKCAPAARSSSTFAARSGHLEREAIPASRCGDSPIRHGLAAPTWAAAGRTEDEPQVAAGQHGEGRSGVHVLVEAELPAVKLDRGIDVVDDVADADSGHRPSPCVVPCLAT